MVDRSPLEMLTAFGICFTLGALSVVLMQTWTRHVIKSREQDNVKT